MELRSICILGRQPELGLAELESLYGSSHVQSIPGAALLDIPAEEINFKRLGGTIKVARVLTELESTDWRQIEKFLQASVPEHLSGVPEGKFTLGISAYNLNVNVKKLNASLLELKKIIKKSGRPVRIVPNKAAELSSAQVLHNGLTRRGAWELLLVRRQHRVVVAQTLFIQDIEAYGARDQARPKRDARVGMLPPKLAQIIINLATGPLSQQFDSTFSSSRVQDTDEQRTEPYIKYGEGAAESVTQQSAESISRATGSAGRQANAAKIRVLDPFCGTGVVLQEAMLMGYDTLGSDIEPRMVEYTKENLNWLKDKYSSIESSFSVELADATNHKWPKFDVVAGEVFLGRPLNSLPDREKLKEIINDADTVIRKFLINLLPQMKSGQKVCIAVPAWRSPNGEITRLPTLANLTDMGYNYLDLKHVQRGELLYYRTDQVVARQLIRIEKK